MQPLGRKALEAVADQAGCGVAQAEAVAQMLAGGDTVPFIARYRKERTGGLDDVRLRALERALVARRQLEDRRAAVLQSVEKQGKLTPVLAAAIASARDRAALEDLYLPYRQRRKSRADAARERGLGPLAEALMGKFPGSPEELAATFVCGDVPDVRAALEGARDIVAETLADDPGTAGEVRAVMAAGGKVTAKAVGEDKDGKYADYLDRTEPLAKVPGHRALAMFRARNEGVVSLGLDVETDGSDHPAERIVRGRNGIGPGDAWLSGAARWAWRTKLKPRLESDLLGALRERAEDEAVAVFARNLKDLLLAAPAGARPVLGLDPGIRTGVKAAVVDATGRLVDHATVYPFPPRNDVEGAVRELASLVRRHAVELVAVGNGTASRETGLVVDRVLASLPAGSRPQKVTVSEAGASVYSASELASEELPGIDVTIRGAVSIARRLQDPLAEIVKIPPMSIGVGQYQHDVDQSKLGKALDAAVEDAVNSVGVDLNTASPSLLSRVAGLGRGLASAIVARRDARGPFRSRKELLDVPGLGPKAFEQCAGFLRVLGGEEPLDETGVHPEAYPLARRIVEACGGDVRAVMGDAKALGKVQAEKFVTDGFGLPTVKDILRELEKPGRDPRPAFRTAEFAEGVEKASDLKVGMRLEGTVTNVAAFGAFVDVGVHQDGLVHVSELADRFVKDPSEVVKAGDVVKVTVTGVDVARNRISLSMRSAPKESAGGRGREDGRPAKVARASGNAFGDAFRDALARRR